MRRALVAVPGVALVAAGGLVLAPGGHLAARGPATLTGTPATALYRIADAPVRELRYADRKRLTYRFTLRNPGWRPVDVVGLARDRPQATLLRVDRLTDTAGASRFGLGPRGETIVLLTVVMTDCERVSSRAGSLLGELRVRVMVMGVARRTVTVALPERLRTQSPRDYACPRSTSATRSPG